MQGRGSHVADEVGGVWSDREPQIVKILAAVLTSYRETSDDDGS